MASQLFVIQLRRIRILTWFFIVGLLVSGVTAIPLLPELDWLVKVTGAEGGGFAQAWPAGAQWLMTVRSALQDVAAIHPFLFYGTDWLAFGHFAIAIAFIGALLDPIRNRWLFLFGMIACVLVVPYAMVMGAVRDIPFWWRCVDAAFGVVGFVPTWLCWKWSGELEARCKTGTAFVPSVAAIKAD
jgi:hypothetical protein